VKLNRIKVERCGSDMMVVGYLSEEV